MTPDTSFNQYHYLLQNILEHGDWQGNRTDQRSCTLPWGSVMRFDMAEGFPAITSKYLFFPGIRGEIIGFLRGLTNAEDFAALGCPWWRDDANVNKDWLASPHRTGPGDMGKVYGYQWRYWECQPDAEGNLITMDQVQEALLAIRRSVATGTANRRIVISAWRPDHFQEMCLPPCHVLYRFQVNVEKGELNMSMYQRSSDMHLGVPMNIAGAALMLHLFAAATGLTPRWFTHHLDDTHIYDKAVEAVHEVLDNAYHKELFKAPKLVIHKDLFGVDADGLAAIEPELIELVDYKFHRLLSDKVPMATSR